MKKACEVYKTKKDYKIITWYQVDIGRYTSREPIFILPLESKIEDLRKCIFDSLNSSKKISYSDYYSENSTKELLKKMKEKSFKGLYNNSSSCSLVLDNNYIRIMPYRKRSDKGLEEIPEKAILMEYALLKEIEITEKIVEILNVNYN